MIYKIYILVEPNAYYLKEYFFATSLNRYELESNLFNLLLECFI